MKHTGGTAPGDLRATPSCLDSVIPTAEHRTNTEERAMRLPFTRLDPGPGDWPRWPAREWPKTRDWKGYVEAGPLRVLSKPGPRVWSVRRSWQNPFNRCRVEARNPDEGASCNYVLASNLADGSEFSLAPVVQLLIPPDVEVRTIAPAPDGGAAIPTSPGSSRSRGSWDGTSTSTGRDQPTSR